MTLPFALDKIRLIAFDLDGTLVDSMASFEKVAARVMRKYFAVSLKEAAGLYKKTSGIPFFYQLQKIFPQHENVEVAASEYEQLKKFSYKQQNYFADVKLSLRALKKSGLTLCVSSNNHESLVVKKLSDLRDCLDVILGYREGFFKGEEHFNHLLAQFDLEKENFLFIGDSLSDAHLAKDFGIPFVARLGTFWRQDFEGLGFSVAMVRDFSVLVNHFVGEKNATRRAGCGQGMPLGKIAS